MSQSKFNSYIYFYISYIFDAKFLVQNLLKDDLYH